MTKFPFETALPKLLQPLNTKWSITVNDGLDGSTMEVKPLQFKNADGPIEETVGPSPTEVKPVQFANALEPIEIALFAPKTNDTDFRLVDAENAFMPMVLILFEMTKSPTNATL